MPYPKNDFDVTAILARSRKGCFFQLYTMDSILRELVIPIPADFLLFNVIGKVSPRNLALIIVKICEKPLKDHLY